MFRIKKTIISALSVGIFLINSIPVNAVENMENNNIEPRKVVCCNNMDYATIYSDYHSPQSYPKCNIITQRISYCRNCYVVFETIDVRTVEHDHPDIFR